MQRAHCRAGVSVIRKCVSWRGHPMAHQGAKQNQQHQNKSMKTKIHVVGLAVCLATAVALISTTGCAGDRYTQSTGEHIDDRATSMRVKSALGDDAQYKYPMVKVKTFKGDCQLSGFVNTRDQKSHAGDIAKRVEGVRNVENNISVKSAN